MQRQNETCGTGSVSQSILFILSLGLGSFLLLQSSGHDKGGTKISEACFGLP